MAAAQGGRDDEAYAAGGGGEGGDINTARFKPDKGFTGADYGKGGGSGGPVQVRRGCGLGRWADATGGVGWVLLGAGWNRPAARVCVVRYPVSKLC